MNMKQHLEHYISRSKKQTVSLSELESLCSGLGCTYSQLAEAVMELEQAGALHMVKAQGRNGKQPSLAYQYRMNRSKTNGQLHKALHAAQLKLHPLIRLDAYYKLPEESWLADLPWLERLDAYLKRQPLPDEPAPAPERSLELVGDEKWITELGGEELLGKIGLWERMNVISVADPLMLAVNPNKLGQADRLEHIHLIVENKTTYQGLLPALPESPFSTIIYGCGKKIIRGIELFPLQVPIAGATHRLYYFGDIDHEGINIWHMLNEKAQAILLAEVRPALPFYQACLNKPYVYGKVSHRKDERALEAFLHEFPEADRQRIQACLSDGGYYPQEIVKSAELDVLWRTASWNCLI